MKRLIYMLSTLVALIGCGPALHETLGPGNAGLSSASVDAFKTTLYPIVTANCARCHGVSQVPMFAVSDPQMGAETIVSFGLVDFNTPANSLMVQKIRGGHNGFAVAVADQIQQAVTDWAAQGGAVSVPPSAPLTATYASISAQILAAKCVSCHGPTLAQAGFRYDTYANTMKTVIAGSANTSKLYTVTNSGAMPPTTGSHLSATELSVIQQWIQAGALNN